jgi:hypothetical protein
MVLGVLHGAIAAETFFFTKSLAKILDLHDAAA